MVKRDGIAFLEDFPSLHAFISFVIGFETDRSPTKLMRVCRWQWSYYDLIVRSHVTAWELNKSNIKPETPFRQKPWDLNLSHFTILSMLFLAIYFILVYKSHSYQICSTGRFRIADGRGLEKQSDQVQIQSLSYIVLPYPYRFAVLFKPAFCQL